MHQSISFVFTERINNSGYDGGSIEHMTYWFLVLPLGFLLTQYTITGFDASAHLDRNVTVRLVQPGVIAGAPIAAFTVTQPNGAAFTDVRFDGSTSTPGLGAVITSYAWDFGDGTGGTGRTATHQYRVSGSYGATLTVTDSNGL